MSNIDQAVVSRVKVAVAARADGALLKAIQPHNDTLQFTIEKTAMRAVVEGLVSELQARFMISVGTDTRPVTGDFAILHLFSLDRAHLYVLLESPVSEKDLRIDSITKVIPGANWAEREFRDAIGVYPEGHPDPRRLLLADDWPEGAYPLRRDFPYNYQPPRAENARPEMRDPPAGASVVPMGPFFPVLEEPSYWRMFVEGETVVGCDTRVFYNHRGIEKLGDTVLTYNEIPYLAERICGICGFIHSTCYCQAVEKAAGIEVPRRARYIRTIMLELERIHSHLLWLGIAGHIIGFETVLMQTWRIREPVMWLCEEISGNRKTYGMNTIGGLRRDLPDAFRPKLLETLAEVEKQTVAVRNAVVGDTTLHARTKGVGVLTSECAKKICTVGPPARASGVPIDARIDHPYAAYDEVSPQIAVQEAGDTWARVLVRVTELLDSLRMVREALAAMPEGPICAEIEEAIPPGRVGVSVVEAPRGEAVHFVLTGGDNRPYRWRVRAPTYPNLQALPAMVANANIADVPITLGSLDPCFSCTERLETVDRSTHDVRVYSRAEILEMSRKGSTHGGPGTATTVNKTWQRSRRGRADTCWLFSRARGKRA
jgi:Ni,Fe-hydrogenase III large subunit/Ni,Fe-hydrogenase III component G